MLVRIFRNWNWPELLQQTPNQSGRWGDFTFTEEPLQEVDFCVVLNNIDENVKLPCPPINVYRIIQEPPTDYFKQWHFTTPYAHKTFSCDDERAGVEYVTSHPMVPWHINRDYDFLMTAIVPDKISTLSCITSTKSFLTGHRKRMDFLGAIVKNIPELELIGTNIHHITDPEERKKNMEEQLRLGFKIVEDKWAGLAPYKYSIAIENYSTADYWTEKIADCFLAWTLPIYYGCKNLEEYFPPDSFVKIDIEDTEGSVATIKKLLQEDSWEKRLDAISVARELVLNKYQLFPYISEQIKRDLTDDSRNIKLTQMVNNYEMMLNKSVSLRQDDVNALTEQLQAVENSLCWKITSPLRSLGDLIRRSK